MPALRLFSSPVHHSGAGEKIGESGGMSLDRVPVFSRRRLLQGSSHRTDGVETVSSSIPFHAMTGDMNLCQVILLQRGLKHLHVTSTIL